MNINSFEINLIDNIGFEINRLNVLILEKNYFALIIRNVLYYLEDLKPIQFLSWQVRIAKISEIIKKEIPYINSF